MMVGISSEVWVGGPPQYHFGEVAQLVERGTEDPGVGGSIPSFTTYWFLIPFCR